jgi:hypothetical protein
MSGVAPVKGDAPEKELTVQERLQALLVSMRNNARHNAPVSPAHVAELESIVAAGGGPVVVPAHDLSKHVLIGKPDGGVVVAYTAEDALDYVRALPADVRDRAYWVVAEKSLLAAIDSGGDAGAATTAFAEALAEDRKTAPVTRKPDELLPDGRIREDRFADRRPPPPPGAAGSPQVAPPKPVAPPPHPLP